MINLIFAAVKSFLAQAKHNRGLALFNVMQHWTEKPFSSSCGPFLHPLVVPRYGLVVVVVARHTAFPRQRRRVVGGQGPAIRHGGGPFGPHRAARGQAPLLLPLYAALGRSRRRIAAAPAAGGTTAAGAARIGSVGGGLDTDGGR
ncbi:hypothetical protein PG995_010274 [Apiospora arundinis]